MPELRLNAATGEWVIIAAARGGRPHEYVRPARRRKRLPRRDQTCAFCPGNEQSTPPAILEAPDPGTPGRWQIRVFPNKYPALVPEPPPIDSPLPLFLAASAEGAHEVIVETPRHDRPTADLSDNELALLVRVYQERYRALTSLPSARYVLLFKNHGEDAGTSIAHPHSQVIAAPIVPEREQRRRRIAREHHAKTGRCLYCDIVEAEIEAGSRVVVQEGGFAVFHPFAAARPAETWIVPLRHEPSFGGASSASLAAFASLLGRTLRRLREGFGDPDYNYAVHSAPPGDEHDPYCHWHLQLIPRTTRAAGFELGSGVYINTAWPEDTAEVMRRAPAR